MTREELDTLWHKSVDESIEAGDSYTHYRYAEYVAALAAAAKPEPATEAELSAALTANHIPPGWWFIFNKGFRAAERWHGITKEGA